MGVDPISLASLGITAASSLFSLSETKKTTKATEEAIEKAEDEATAAADTTAQETADAEAETERKRKDRLKELATGGRAAQIKTSSLGITDTANTGKKTLLGA